MAGPDGAGAVKVVASGKTALRPQFCLGATLGRISVCTELASRASTFASKFWASQLANDFNEQVDTWKQEDGLDWLPLDTLAKLGLRPVQVDGHWVATTGVDNHTDQAFGMTLIWVLENGQIGRAHV